MGPHRIPPVLRHLIPPSFSSPFPKVCLLSWIEFLSPSPIFPETSLYLTKPRYGKMATIQTLPQELILEIFVCIVRSRTPARMARLRLVSSNCFCSSFDMLDVAIDMFFAGWFRDAIDNAINYMAYFRVPGDHNSWVSGLHVGSFQPCRAYLISYLAYQARREQRRDPLSYLGRVIRAATILCETDNDRPDNADDDFEFCLRSLLDLSIDEIPDIKWLLLALAYVQELVAKGVWFCSVGSGTKWNWNDVEKLRSAVFGESKSTRCALMLKLGAEYERRAQFEDALASIKSLAADGLDILSWKAKEMLESIMNWVKLPDTYERIPALPGFTYPFKEGGDIVDDLLIINVADGNADMKYTGSILQQLSSRPSLRPLSSESPLFEPAHIARHQYEAVIRILMAAAAAADANWVRSSRLFLASAAERESISLLLVKLFLGGADVNEGTMPFIVSAVMHEREDMFRLLQDHGATLDTPRTGSRAMTVAKLQGLDSMVQLLVKEGVDPDAKSDISLEHIRPKIRLCYA
ncbi:hypothetical protein B0H66DRAFT_585679 [Apodospora peruviana]|uniref:Uncharacterized protein n=1 Tax=Apodospora peruviana TaxID=516989 RepID=A0AAE0IQ70_9PEZI|nr:hypothetical protein B0H66DRAFT_585679 [Apodospora peruviana]